jgi:uncharacterized protein with PIN domain
MIQRQCPECKSELVRTRCPNIQKPGIAPVSSSGWRCSVCGRGFTLKEIREGNGAKVQAIGP